MLYLTLYIYGFKSIENKVNCCIISQSLHWYSFMENVYNYTINDVYENVILIYTRGRHHNPTRASALLAISYHGQCRIKAFVGPRLDIIMRPPTLLCPPIDTYPIGGPRYHVHPKISPKAKLRHPRILWSPAFTVWNCVAMQTLVDVGAEGVGTPLSSPSLPPFPLFSSLLYSVPVSHPPLVSRSHPPSLPLISLHFPLCPVSGMGSAVSSR